jgi:hypothetical protein
MVMPVRENIHRLERIFSLVAVCGSTSNYLSSLCVSLATPDPDPEIVFKDQAYRIDTDICTPMVPTARNIAVVRTYIEHLVTHEIALLTYTTLVHPAHPGETRSTTRGLLQRVPRHYSSLSFPPPFTHVLWSSVPPRVCTTVASYECYLLRLLT